MPAPEELLDLYLRLADAAQEQQQPLQRNKFLVLAADAAGRAGLLAVAEDCRTKILAHNPKHILRQYPSMGEALASKDVRLYTRQLHRLFPFEKAEYLLSKFEGTNDDASFVLDLDPPAKTPRRRPKGSKRPSLSRPKRRPRASIVRAFQRSKQETRRKKTIRPTNAEQRSLPILPVWAVSQPKSLWEWGEHHWSTWGVVFLLGVVVGGSSAALILLNF
ncbi:hypothetical protein Pan216_53630 [Planctomycetes bacterium Pan216]|uniref:Uncharacterized protein n=1 Tax=Kolteria novifilia TaxID=2527975 RepID=A0A518BC48_9BACT|nr:hypothetical protein Pan216_53630 [Planctomycetes bacterium Pan216]